MAETEEKGRDVTRRELADALAEATRINKALAERVEKLEANQIPPVSEAALRKELAEARELLAARTVAPLKATAEVKLVRYAGLVQATADCCMEHRHAAGEVFEVDVPALWTDDPYMPVIVTGYTDDGTPKTQPNAQAPTPIDFRFRKVVSIAEDPTPRRAAEY
jgi:hypothetical protein